VALNEVLNGERKQIMEHGAKEDLCLNAMIACLFVATVVVGVAWLKVAFFWQPHQLA